jgi:hypothetical protein
LGPPVEVRLAPGSTSPDPSLDLIVSSLRDVVREELRIALRPLLQSRPTTELLSKRAAARALGIGRDTLQRLIGSDQIKTTPWEEGVRISRDEVDRVKRDGVQRAVAMCSSSGKRKKSASANATPGLLKTWRHPSERCG